MCELPNPPKKTLPVVNSGKQRIQAEVGPAASRVQSESSDLAWASVPSEARLRKTVLILCRLRYDGSRARPEDRHRARAALQPGDAMESGDR